MINIQSDSRKIKKGDTFIALRGIGRDGHTFIDTAISNGATKIIAEKVHIRLKLKLSPIRVYI